MYRISYTKNFYKTAEKLVVGNRSLTKAIEKTVESLRTNPYNSALKTHQVNTLQHGEQRSSRVTGDVRIIWNFDQNEKLVILVLDMVTHSGKHRVYK